MKIISVDKSWDQHDDILICEDIHPLYTRKILNLLNVKPKTGDQYNRHFIEVEDDYKLHIKQIGF